MADTSQPINGEPLGKSGQRGLSTDTQIRGLKTEKSRYERQLTGAKGLLIVVQPSGTKQFVLRYTAQNGKRRRLVLGNYGELRDGQPYGLLDARIDANKHRNDIRRRRRDPVREAREAKRLAEQEAARRAGDTLDAIQDAYMKAAPLGLHGGRRKPRRASALKVHKYIYDARLKPVFGHRPVAEITQDDIQEHLETLTTEGTLKPVSIRGVAAVIRVLLAFAVHRKKLTANPAAGVYTVKTDARRKRLIEEDGLRKLWGALIANSELRGIGEGTQAKSLPLEPQLALALRFLFLTLVRRNEGAGARWAEIDFDSRVWIIPPERMKAKREHIVPLSDSALHVLRLAKAASAGVRSEFVFPSRANPKEPLSGDTVTGAMYRVMAALELPRASPHDMRRVGVTTLVSERFSVPDHIAERLLAHAGMASGSAISHYNLHRYVREKREALAKWAEHLDGLVSESTPSPTADVVQFRPRNPK
jgi:integrase